MTERLLKEGQEIINRNSEIITDDFIGHSIRLFQSYPDHMGTSMYYDVMEKKETEYEFIQKDFYDNKGDLHTPVLDVTYTLLKAYSCRKAGVEMKRRNTAHFVTNRFLR